MANNNSILGRTILTHILVRRMTEYHHCENYGSDISTLILTRRMTKRFQRIYSDIFISTLILTKRMTEEVEDDETGENISTHILTKRMTWIFTTTRWRIENFNSHPHKEDDSNFKQNHFI